ncbi:hypothetical protein AB0M32_40720 [Streptomyces sp. NPDC051985]|uniref:hypothetical protein n=1 Tax=Streptomyces sp. NPDC051985 TaxID=3155807 RepID=UPI00343651CA
MTPITAPVSTFTRPRRTLAVAALAALALAGCGADGSGDSGSAGRSTSERAAFAAMLDEVAQPCSSTTEPEEGEGLAPTATPPTEPTEPGAPAEARLSDRDWCASVQHEQRIIQALQAVPDPTPAKVRRSLNALGYIDERIHGLQQDGEVTRFRLDLRAKGGRLCEAGTAAGEETDVVPCVAPATGSFEKQG